MIDIIYCIKCERLRNTLMAQLPFIIAKAKEKALEEKSLLISEINHRVKNNLAIITAIIRSESDRVKDNFHKGLFDSILSKTYSLASLQEELYRSANYQELNFNKYIEQLADNMIKEFNIEV